MNMVSSLNCLACFFCLFLNCIFSCKNKPDKILYYDNGHIKELKVISADKKIATYVFDENGGLRSINRFNKNKQVSGEQLIFYPSGFLSQKILFDQDILNGSAYYYYDSSGAVKHFRYFKKGKQILFGVDYWNDSIGIIKSSLHFNDNGEVYFIKKFNQNGEPIGEEGNRK